MGVSHLFKMSHYSLHSPIRMDSLLLLNPLVLICCKLHPFCRTTSNNNTKLTTVLSCDDQCVSRRLFNLSDMNLSFCLIVKYLALGHLVLNKLIPRKSCGLSVLNNFWFVIRLFRFFNTRFVCTYMKVTRLRWINGWRNGKTWGQST